MNAKDLLIDFLNYAFLIAIIVFAIVFFIVGDRFATFTAIIKSLLPLAIFSSIFLFSFKSRKIQKKKIELNGTIEEVVVSLTKVDKMKDILIIILVICFVLAVPLVFNSFVQTDFVQIVALFIAMMTWNYYLFRVSGNGDVVVITTREILNDEIVTFLFPIIVYVVAYFSVNAPNLVDAIQSVVPLIVMYFWHYFLFNKSSLNR